MNITAQMVKDNYVWFQYYRDGSLWYLLRYTEQSTNGVTPGKIKEYLFPVPISDIGTATFLREDKAILFMRWMRKWAAEMENA